MNEFQRSFAALATVVSVEGSSYRRPGARMLITESGETTGILSGGCLELDFDRVDAAGEDTFNRILWSIIKGAQPYPGTKRMSSLDIAREH